MIAVTFEICFNVLTARHFTRVVYGVPLYPYVSLSVCPFVTLSSISVLSKWLNSVSRKQCCVIVQGLYGFLMPKISEKLWWAHSHCGQQIQVG